MTGRHGLSDAVPANRSICHAITLIEAASQCSVLIGEIDMEKLPANSGKSVAEFLREAIAASGKTHEQVAAELGYDGGSVIKMVAAGMTKLPINKIKEIAAVLAVDPAELLGLTLENYLPGLGHLIEELFGGLALSQSEKRLIAAVRAQGHGAE